MLTPRIKQSLHLVCDLFLRKFPTELLYAFHILQCLWDKSSGVLLSHMTRLNLMRPPELEARGSKKGCCEIILRGPAFRKKILWVKAVTCVRGYIISVTDHINKNAVKAILLEQDILNANYCLLTVETHVIRIRNPCSSLRRSQFRTVPPDTRILYLIVWFPPVLSAKYWGITHYIYCQLGPR